MSAKLINGVCIIVIGLGIGWMVGLAVSPVVSIVLTSVMGTVAAIIAAASGLAADSPNGAQAENSFASRFTVNPLPTAILIVGIFTGSLLGIRARNANWLGQTPQAEVARWRSAGLGLSDEQIIQRLFAQEYPGGDAATLAAAAPAAVPLGMGTMLFGVGVDECNNLIGSSGDTLRQKMLLSSNKQVRLLPAVISDDAELQRLVEEVLCTATS